MKKMLVLWFLLCSIALQAQSFKLQGVVTDGTEPLPGVSILIKGKSIGTITDFDGNYAIEVSKGEILVVSYIGYETQNIPYKGEKTLNIRLKESINELSEAVVVGYATQKKATLTGSVASVNSETLNKRTVASLSTALQGTM
ncbi:MAG: carboxypeptidase-like regulatory domain-containing protein, partial [Bacteroidales bacterium]